MAGRSATDRGIQGRARLASRRLCARRCAILLESGFTRPRTAPWPLAWPRPLRSLGPSQGAVPMFHTSPSDNAGERLSSGVCHATLRPQCSPTVRPPSRSAVFPTGALEAAQMLLWRPLLARRHVRANRQLIQYTTFYSSPPSPSASPRQPPPSESPAHLEGRPRADLAIEYPLPNPCAGTRDSACGARPTPSRVDRGKSSLSTNTRPTNGQQAFQLRTMPFLTP